MRDFSLLQAGGRREEAVSLYFLSFYARLKERMEPTPSPQSGPVTLQITLQGKVCHVQEDNLIWIFQEMGLIRFSNKFCWNGECKNCVVTFKIGPGGEEITERACRTPAQDGMIVTEMPTQFYKKT